MNIYLKSLLYLIIFSILHFGYDVTHWAFLAPFCGINESVFQHLKMAFWAYLLASLIEYIVVRRKLSKGKVFWFPRLLSAALIPWFVMLIWYLVPALYGKVEILTLEIVWSVFSAYTAGVMGGIIEKNIEENMVTLNFKIIVVILTIVSAFLYIWFTYKPPWIDVFISPQLL
ncbi:MAG: hypothetical protein JSV97_02575 [candidate division WOR-3 bacterium]|nr:MAG: hypothetical protein JSV97_02575 [candidate division WOR-3 bacterium]